MRVLNSPSVSIAESADTATAVATVRVSATATVSEFVDFLTATCLVAGLANCVDDADQCRARSTRTKLSNDDMRVRRGSATARFKNPALRKNGSRIDVP